VSAILLSGLVDHQMAGAEECSAPSFAAARRFDAGTNPVFVAVGDFNGDGKPDLAVADDGYDASSATQENGAVWVLLGNGDGTFQAPVRYSTVTHPQSVAVGDFNGDGKPDLAVANYIPGNVSLLLGNGNGTFQAEQIVDRLDGAGLRHVFRVAMCREVLHPAPGLPVHAGAPVKPVAVWPPVNRGQDPPLAPVPQPFRELHVLLAFAAQLARNVGGMFRDALRPAALRTGGNLSFRNFFRLN
jgi:hypothetical protein